MTNLFRQALLLCRRPWAAFLFSFLAYAAAASRHGPLTAVSGFPYYSYLADAFLHGQLALRNLPGTTHDLVHYAGKYYLYWPPMPAIVVLPFVALWGVDFSDIFFTIILGAFNCALMTVFLDQLRKKNIIDLSDVQLSLLGLFFALGTVHLTLAPLGRVWFTGQLVGFCFTLLAYLAALTMEDKKAFFFTGLALACAMLTRNHLLFTGLWPAYYLWKRYRPLGWKQFMAWGALGLLSILVAGSGLLFYNWLRFANPFEVGLTYHQMATLFRSDYVKYGAFNLHYLPINLFYQYINYPLPFSDTSTMGGSLFLLSPVFFAAFWGFRQLRSQLSSLAAALSILITNIPILLLMGTGWVQFGPRYTLDFTVPLMLLTAAGVKRIPDPLLGLLTTISILQYVYGTLLLIKLV